MHVDLLAETECLLRTLAQTRTHLDQLGTQADDLTPAERADLAARLCGGLKTAAENIEVLRQMLPETLRAADSLRRSLCRRRR